MRAVLLLCAACGAAAPDEPPPLPGDAPPPCELAWEGWMITSVAPIDDDEAFDLDGDGARDNALGDFAAAAVDDPDFAWGLNVERCADQRIDHLRVELLAGTYDAASGTLLVELGGVPSVGASGEAVLGRGFAPVALFAGGTAWGEAFAVAAAIETDGSGRLGMAFRGLAAPPDVDLFADGVFWPGRDGVDDATSVAFRYTAERVDLWPPP